MAREASLPRDDFLLATLSEQLDASPVAIAEHRKPQIVSPEPYTVERNGQLYAGTHVLIDLWGASELDNINHVEQALREATDVCGATLLHIHLHEFSTNGGISGVAVLAESHISVHTWPEYNFAAFDVFMCGDCDPHLAVPVLKRYFTPDRAEVIEQMRGKHG